MQRKSTASKKMMMNKISKLRVPLLATEPSRNFGISTRASASSRISIQRMRRRQTRDSPTSRHAGIRTVYPVPIF